MTEQPPLFAIIESLIDRWCERRALEPLRAVLPAYPLVSGLSDEWHQLHQALRTARMTARDSLPAAEANDLDAAIRGVDRALRAAGQRP